MTSATHAIADEPRIREDLSSNTGRRAPGPIDGLGDRLLTADDAQTPPTERLRFKADIGNAPGFEAALRDRVELLSHVRHPSFSIVRDVEAGERLTLVSDRPSGIRLSEILKDARGSAFALELIRQIAPALAMLHEQGPEIAHGVVTPERIVVTKEGRLVLIEHVLGGALNALGLPVDRARFELGLAVPDGKGPVAFDQRSDVIQLGFIALSLALGRRLQPAEYPARIRATLDEFSRADAVMAARLRPWLERALQIGEQRFASAKDANEAYTWLAAEPSHERANRKTANASSTAAPALTEFPLESPFHEPTGSDAPEDAGESSVDLSSGLSAAKRAPAASGSTGRAWQRAAITLAALALGEGAVIGGLMLTRLAGAEAPIVVTAPRTEPGPATAAPVPEGAPTGLADTASASTIRPPASAVAEPAAQVAAGLDAASTPPPAAAAPDAAAPVRFGSVQITSPIELQVLESGRLLGTTSGPVSLARGPHTLELVDETLGFRASQRVNVTAGDMSPIVVALPNGRISINAVPWADVWIDGASAGQTPLANLAIPIGTHEVVFRHPQFGEQRQTAVVKVEGLTRVSATLQRER